MLILSQHLYRITYTTHTYIQYTITSQLQHTSHNLQSCKAGHTLPFFPILAKTSISSILHGTDGRQLKSSLVYIYTGTTQHYTRATVAASQEESELFAPKELYEQPRPAPSTKLLQLTTPYKNLYYYVLSSFSLRF